VQVGGAALSVRPGCHATLVERTLHPFVRRWAAEGFCGMRPGSRSRTRSPRASDVALKLGERRRHDRRRRRGRGAPERLASWTPATARWTSSASPFLRFSAREMVPPADGRVAAAERSRPRRRRARPGALPAAPRTTLRFGDAACLADAPSDVALESGGETSLPADVSYYDSNHMTGEVRTEVHLVRDGVRAVLTAPAAGCVRCRRSPGRGRRGRSARCASPRSRRATARRISRSRSPAARCARTLLRDRGRGVPPRPGVEGRPAADRGRAEDTRGDER